MPKMPKVALAKQPAEEARLEYVPISKIQPALRNPKDHDAAGIASLIRSVGFIDPLLENAATGRLIAGHGAYEALQLILLEDGIEKPPKYIQRDPGGEWQVPVIRGVSFASEAEAEAYLIADNRAVELGGWHRQSMEKMLGRMLKTRIPDTLSSIGWPSRAIERFLSETGAKDSRGRTPSDLAPGYNAGAVKSIVLYFPSNEYEAMLARIEGVMAKEKVDTVTAALMAALARYEKDFKIK